MAQENSAPREELQTALVAARNLPAEALPRFLGDLEEVRTTALARLTAPVVSEGRDELLSCKEAAALLSVSPSYLYRHHSKFKFTRRMGRSVLFSAEGIQHYIRRKP
jgi:predicted DNA-binding transcriptional regulator AlpA